MDQSISSADAQLKRVIGPGAIALNAMNLTIGSGIFALPAAVAAIVGPAAIYAYLICGAAITLVLLCFAELGSTTSRSGGGYAYIHRAFGPFWAFLVSVLLWFAFGIVADAAVGAAMVDTIAGAFPLFASPLPRALLLVTFFATVIVVNIRGAKEGARMAVILTIIKLLPLAVLVIAALPSVTTIALTGGGVPSAASLGKASLLLFFAFAGAEASLAPSAEIRNVRTDIPRGIMLGVLGIVLVYLCVHIAAQSVLGAQLAKEGSAPLAAAAAVVLGPLGKTLLLAGGALSMAALISGDMLATPRTLFATAIDGQLPAILARVHPRFATPWVAIALYGSLGCLLALLGGFAPLAALASAGLLLVYFAVCLAVLRERTRRAHDAKAGFRIPGGPIVPLLGMAMTAGLLFNAAVSDWKALGGLMLVASAYYAARRFTRRTTSSDSSTSRT